MITSNSSTLISLAKIGKLRMLKSLNEAIICPSYVYKESVEEGKKKGLTDALLIQALFNEGVIKTAEVNLSSWNQVKEKIGKELKHGDHSVIALAIQTGSKKVLTDDDELAKIAEVLDIKAVSAPDIILTHLKNKKIGFSEFQNSVNDLVAKNRISLNVSEVYLNRGEEVANR